MTPIFESRSPDDRITHWGDFALKIIRPLLGRLTQGSLFTCARAERYSHASVHGFVITARCDVKQDKYPILNYLPVVSLDDWLMVDGFEILHSRSMSECRGSLKKLMKERGIAESILFSASYNEIEKVFFSEPYSDKAHRGHSERFSKYNGMLSRLDQIENRGLYYSKELFGMNEGASSALIRELALQKLPGYYFLPSIYDSGDGRGHVILLREVKHLSRDAAAAIANGLEGADAAATAAEYGLCFEYEPFAMPIGEVPSPHVEHILQTFSHLFGRIGLEDLPKDYLDTIVARRPEPKGQI